MTPLQAIILAVTEGLTEFLPISSTGHMILVSAIFKIPQTEFTKSFEIFIQLGAILAVVATFWRTFLPNNLKTSSKSGIKPWFETWFTVFIAFVPTSLIGFIAYKLVKDTLLGNLWVTLIALLVGGVAIILIEAWHKGKKKTDLTHISPIKAVMIGLFQALAVIPGVSRSAATISGGLILGLPRITAVEFSFLLAVPTMLGATALDLYKSQHSFSVTEYKILTLGFIVAFATALVAIKFFLSFVQKRNLTVFGIYRIVLAIILGLFFFVLTPKVTTSKSTSLQFNVVTESSSSAKIVSKTPILTYHYLENVVNKNDKLRVNLAVTPEKFEEQLKYLTENQFNSVTLSEWAVGVSPLRPVVLTFDDGYSDFYINAVPLLQKYSFKATLFIPTSLLDKPDHLTSDQVRELAKSPLIEIADHSSHHWALNRLPYQLVLGELSTSRKKLQEISGQAVNFTAYPYGYFNKDTEKAATAAGFWGAVTTKSGYAIAVSFEIPRMRISNYDLPSLLVTSF